MSEPSGRPAPSAPALASLPRRLGAALYESLELGAITLLGSALSLPLGAGLAMPAPAERWTTFGVVLVLVTLYCTSLWSRGRRTLAMRTWRMHLADTAGAVIPGRRAFLRFAMAMLGPLAAVAAYVPLHRVGWGSHAAWCLGLGFAWAIVDRDRQFLHDRLAGTRMVDDRPGASRGGMPPESAREDLSA